MTKARYALLVTTVLALLLIAISATAGEWWEHCPPDPPTRTPWPEQATLTPLPTLTPQPTLTPNPTPTCRPTATLALNPSPTPFPTHTPYPAHTPYPTSTPYPTQPYQSTYYIDATDGSDDSDGLSPAAAWQTIAKVNMVSFSPGDQILFKRGQTWSGENGLTFTSSGTVAARIIIGAYGSGADPIWQLDTVSLIQYCQYVTMMDIVVDGSSLQGNHANIALRHEARYIRIQNCESKNSPHHGIITQKTNGGELQADYNEIIDCLMHNNGTLATHHGIYLETGNNLISGCDAYNNAGFGIHIFNEGAATASNNVVKNCRCYDNAVSGSGSGILLGSGSGNLAYNNLCWGNKHGIHVEFLATDTLIYNNTCYNNWACNVNVENSSTDAIARNNIAFFGADWGNYCDQGIDTAADHNLFAANPQFVDASVYNFHLHPTSPAIDTGVALSEVLDDFDGVSRPRGAGYDIGAYEYIE